MRRVGFFAPAISVMLAFSAVAAEADDSTQPAPSRFCVPHPGNQVCGVKGDSSFDFVGANGSESTRRPGSSGGSRPGGQSETVRRYSYAPACSGNERAGEVLCTNSLTACGKPPLLLYWIWSAVVNRQTGALVADWARLPGAVCLGPSDPGVAKADVVAGYLAHEFQKALVLKATVVAQPAGTTLVNYDTGFYTEAKDYQLPSLTILGSTIEVRAHAVRYDWFFGDGAGLVDGGPGAKDTTNVAHRYLATGLFRAHVEIVWSGTYTVDGGPQRTVVGTARTYGPEEKLVVREARAELVSR